MTCDQLEIWISAYQDGELDARRRRLVEEHLAGCSACRALGDELAALAGALRAGLERWDPPETLHTYVMRRIPEPKPVSTPGSRTPRGWLSFGLVPAGIMAAWLLTMKPVWSPPGPADTPHPTVRKAVVPPPSGVGSAAPTHGAWRQAADPANSGIPRVAAPQGPGAAHHPAVGEPKGGSRKASPARSAGARNGSVRRAPRTGTELESLRRLLQPRPPRWQNRMARAHRRRPPIRMAKWTEPVRPRTDRRADPSRPRITVVDYVLPEVPTPAAEPEARTKTDFVLRAAEPYQVSQASFDY